MKSLSRKNYIKYYPYSAPRPTVSVDWSPVIAILVFVAVVIVPIFVGR